MVVSLLPNVPTLRGEFVWDDISLQYRLSTHWQTPADFFRQSEQ